MKHPNDLFEIVELFPVGYEILGGIHPMTVNHSVSFSVPLREYESERLYGTLKIEMKPDKLSLDYETFDGWIRSLDSMKDGSGFVPETFGRTIFNVLWHFLQPEYLKITVRTQNLIFEPVEVIIENKKLKMINEGTVSSVS